MKRKFTRTDGYIEKDLIQFGVDHIFSAELLFKENPRTFDSAGYLCHLGFELIFKAIILMQNEYFEDIHALKCMLPTVKNYISFSKKQEEIIDCIDTYSELRYPNTMNPYEVGDDDWERIIALFSYIIDALPMKLKEDIKSIDFTKKGGRILMYKKLANNDKPLKNRKIEDAINKYLTARNKIIELGERYPEEIGGNDNIIGRIGEYIGLQFLRRIGQKPIKVSSKSNQGFDFIDGNIYTQVKVITSENERGRNVRLKKPWNQLILIELDREYIPKRIGLITQAQHEKARIENPDWSLFPIVKLTMLSPKGLIGRYGKVYYHNEIDI